jgi:hypothetical protein
MSAIRKIVLSSAALFLGLAAPLVVTSTATAQSVSIECDDDWHSPCP